MTECQMFTARPHSTAHSTLSGNDRFGRLRFDAEQLKRSAERSSVDRQLVAFDQLLHWHRAKLPSVGGLTGRDFLVVVNRAGAGLQQMQVAVRRVLIERDEHVDLVTHVAHWRIARANRQECMSATDDRLIGVVGIQMEPAPREDPGENVPRRGDTLAVLAANADCEIYFSKFGHLFIEGGLCWTERAYASPSTAKFAHVNSSRIVRAKSGSVHRTRCPVATATSRRLEPCRLRGSGKTI